MDRQLSRMLFNLYNQETKGGSKRIETMDTIKTHDLCLITGSQLYWWAWDPGNEVQAGSGRGRTQHTAAAVCGSNSSTPKEGTVVYLADYGLWSNQFTWLGQNQ